MKPEAIVRRLRWVMVGVILFDFANTLLGQPITYWQHPETVNEHNQLINSIATHGCLFLILFMALYTVGAFLLVTFLRGRLALVGLFAFVLCHFHGGASWLERHWGFGNAGAIVYGIVLAAVLVVVGFPASD